MRFVPCFSAWTPMSVLTGIRAVSMARAIVTPSSPNPLLSGGIKSLKLGKRGNPPEMRQGGLKRSNHSDRSLPICGTARCW
jgi:hypothetical protein